MKTYGRMEADLHAVLISTLDGSEWAAFTPQKDRSPQWPRDSKLGGYHRYKYLLLLLGIKHRLLGAQPSHYID
jgi:hypothetical protein